MCIETSFHYYLLSLNAYESTLSFKERFLRGEPVQTIHPQWEASEIRPWVYPKEKS